MVTAKEAAAAAAAMDASKYVRYTPEQVEALERLYYECPKPSSLRRQQLVRDCPVLASVDPKQIKVWFQNRRYGTAGNYHTTRDVSHSSSPLAPALSTRARTVVVLHGPELTDLHRRASRTHAGAGRSSGRSRPGCRR
jgi:hypothetical protein